MAEVKLVVKQVDQGSDGIKAMGSKWDSLKSGALAAGLAIGAAAATMRAAYKVIGEGAELELARGRFERLSESIGVASDAMLGDLRSATKGMVSDAELMASASQLISLGLADSQEGVSRLATVISSLGLDMNQVILTFANNSIMRLDALGLSVEGVKTKAAELEAAGFKGDAFDEAVLISLEEKMTLLGDASETTAGQLKIIEADWKNLSDGWKTDAAVAAGPIISGMVDQGKALAILRKEYEEGRLTFFQWQAASGQVRNVNADAAEVMRDYGIAVDEYGNALSNTVEDVEAMVKQSEMLRAEMVASEAASADFVLTTNTAPPALKGAQGAASDFGAELARLTQLGAEAQQTQNALNQEMNAMTAGALGDVDSTIGDPIRSLLAAQQALADSQGEWVQATVSSASKIGDVSAQLAGDLSNDQANAMRDILKTVDEGSAEWLAAYNALQGDLSESQRQALIAQRAELEAAGDSTVSVYTGSIEDAEAAQAAIDEANQAILDSYRELAFEGALALAELSPNPDAIQRTLDYAVAIGQMTQEEANLRLQAAETRIGIEELNEMVVKTGLDTNIAALAFELLATGQARTAEEAIAAAEKHQILLDLFAQTPQKVETAYTLFMGDSIARLQEVKGILDGLDGRNVSSSVTVNTSGAQDLGSGGNDPEKKALGGAVSGGMMYQAGEYNQPEILQQGNSLYLIPGDQGRVFSNSQSGMGGININGPLIGQVVQRAGESGPAFANRLSTMVAEKLGNLK